MSQRYDSPEVRYGSIHCINVNAVGKHTKIATTATYLSCLLSSLFSPERRSLPGGQHGQTWLVSAPAFCPSKCDPSASIKRCHRFPNTVRNPWTPNCAFPATGKQNYSFFNSDHAGTAARPRRQAQRGGRFLAVPAKPMFYSHHVARAAEASLEPNHAK